MPYPRLDSEEVDPKQGFARSVQPAWLLVERRGDVCKAIHEVDPRDMEGLFEQIGRNTRYLWHPEEILADNFALMAIGVERGAPLKLPSPEIQDRLRAILLK